MIFDELGGLDKHTAGPAAGIDVPTDFDTIEKALSRANAAEKGLK